MFSSSNIIKNTKTKKKVSKFVEERGKDSWLMIQRRAMKQQARVVKGY
jgi:hypothetical protein